MYVQSLWSSLGLRRNQLLILSLIVRWLSPNINNSISSQGTINYMVEPVDYFV